MLTHNCHVAQQPIKCPRNFFSNFFDSQIRSHYITFGSGSATLVCLGFSSKYEKAPCRVYATLSPYLHWDYEGAIEDCSGCIVGH